MPDAKVDEMCSNLKGAEDLVLRALQIHQALPSKPIGSTIEFQALHFRIRAMRSLLCLSDENQGNYSDPT
jgi:hypothetical protein